MEIKEVIAKSEDLEIAETKKRDQKGD